MNLQIILTLPFFRPKGKKQEIVDKVKKKQTEMQIIASESILKFLVKNN